MTEKQDRVRIGYGEKRTVEDAIRSHIREGKPKFKDMPSLAQALSELLDLPVTVGILQGIFKSVHDLDRTMITARTSNNPGGPRKPLNMLRDEVSSLTRRIEKLEKFMKEYTEE